MKKEKWVFKNNWVLFYFEWCFNISFETCGYFDNRPCINLDLIFFSLCLTLPFRNKYTDECDSPKYGIEIHHDRLWVAYGGTVDSGIKYWTWDIPFISKDWVRSSIMLKDCSWEHDVKGDRKSFYEPEWKEKQKSYLYNYTDSFDGEVIPTTIYVQQREWRRKWLKWTKLFNIVITSIDVHFSKECGKEKGSWKGGALGCSYNLLRNEEPLDCIRRMERERKS